jgi:Spy/CpxP family protein refolding chaperone
MPDDQKGDRIWLTLCTATGITVDVTLNKYSSQLPSYVVLGLWAIPCLLFVYWLWRVEKTNGWVKRRFFEHPVSYVVMFLILIPFAWQATRTMVCKLQTPAPTAQSSPAASEPSTSPAKSDSPSPAKPLVSTVPKTKTSQVIKSPAKGPAPDNGVVSGTDNTIVGNVPYRSIDGNGNTIVGATDSNGNTILNKGGTAIGNGAKADSTSVAIGAHANAGGNVAAPQSQPCIGSNCFQGTNSGTVIQTLNQYGAPKLVMTDAQRDAIRDAMKPYAGTGIRIFCHAETEDSRTYAEKLRDALKNAGLHVEGPYWASWVGLIPAGPSFGYSADNKPAADTLAHTMLITHLIDKPVPANVLTDRNNYFDITIAPNR